MTKTFPLLGLAAGLALGLNLGTLARADDRVALARGIVEATVTKNLGTAFLQARERSLASLSPEQADRLRGELDKGFADERAKLLDELSKEYAQKFSADELKQIAKIYEDPVYQKFQAVNADPNSLASTITKTAVTRMMNMLAMATMAQQQPGAGPVPPKQ